MNSNMDDFNRGCACILGALYREFPVPVELRMDALAGDHIVQTIYGHTVTFLADAGLLSFVAKTEDNAVFTGVRLTAMGLNKLNEPAE